MKETSTAYEKNNNSVSWHTQCTYWNNKYSTYYLPPPHQLSMRYQLANNYSAPHPSPTSPPPPPHPLWKPQCVTSSSVAVVSYSHKISPHCDHCPFTAIHLIHLIIFNSILKPCLKILIVWHQIAEWDNLRLHTGAFLSPACTWSGKSNIFIYTTSCLVGPQSDHIFIAVLTELGVRVHVVDFSMDHIQMFVCSPGPTSWADPFTTFLNNHFHTSHNKR